MDNLRIQHWTDGHNKDGKHTGEDEVGIDVWADIKGERTLVASLTVKYRRGFPRIVLCTAHSDVRFEQGGE